jgi:hypothetical protein
MKILKLITIGLIAIQSFGLSAQVTFYKIKDGAKTVLPEGENLKFQLDDKGKPIGNVLIEVNVPEFRKKYNFDDILIAFGPPTRPLSQTLRISHTFEEEYIKKKYANVNVLNFYAFMNSDFKEQLGNSSPTFSTYYIPNDDMKKTFHYRIIGRYKTGTEKYWDDKSNSYKLRDLFESTEILSKVDITFEENKAITLSSEYAALIYSNSHEYNGVPSIYNITRDLKSCAKELDKITVGFGPATKKKYKNLANAIYEIAIEKEKEIKEEKDKAKALELFYEWHEISKKLCIEDDKPKSEQLKTLEKSLGASKTIVQKIELIKNYLNN